MPVQWRLGASPMTFVPERFRGRRRIDDHDLGRHGLPGGGLTWQ
jgi:hypothetical protein